MAAEAGHVAAQLRLADMYRTGEGVAKDEAEALAWFRRAAAQGSVPAQFFVGPLREGEIFTLSLHVLMKLSST